MSKSKISTAPNITARIGLYLEKNVSILISGVKSLRITLTRSSKISASLTASKFHAELKESFLLIVSPLEFSDN